MELISFNRILHIHDIKGGKLMRLYAKQPQIKRYIVYTIALIICTSSLSNCTTVGMILTAPFGAKPHSIISDKAIAIDGDDSRAAFKALQRTQNQAANPDSAPSIILTDGVSIEFHGGGYSPGNAGISFTINNRSQNTVKIIPRTIRLESPREFSKRSKTPGTQPSSVRLKRIVRSAVGLDGKTIGDPVSVAAQEESEISKTCLIVSGTSGYFYTQFASNKEYGDRTLTQPAIFSMLVEIGEGHVVKLVAAHVRKVGGVYII
jgi:hypothetical protein